MRKSKHKQNHKKEEKLYENRKTNKSQYTNTQKNQTERKREKVSRRSQAATSQHCGHSNNSRRRVFDRCICCSWVSSVWLAEEYNHVGFLGACSAQIVQRRWITSQIRLPHQLLSTPHPSRDNERSHSISRRSHLIELKAHEGNTIRAKVSSARIKQTEGFSHKRSPSLELLVIWKDRSFKQGSIGVHHAVSQSGNLCASLVNK